MSFSLLTAIPISYCTTGQSDPLKATMVAIWYQEVNLKEVEYTIHKGERMKGGNMHNPTVCLLSSSSLWVLLHPVSLHREPLLLMFSSTPQNCSKKNHRLRTFRACLNRGCLSTCVTHWPAMSKQRYFISLLPFGRLVSHFWLTDTERGGSNQQFIKLFVHKMSKIWV